MPMQQRARNAQRPNRSENASAALVDPPQDGTHPTLDGRDESVDSAAGKRFQELYERTLQALDPDTLRQDRDYWAVSDWRRDLSQTALDYICGIDTAALTKRHAEYSACALVAIDQASRESCQRLDSLEESIRNNSDALQSRFEVLLTTIGDLRCENTMLREAYNSTKAETAALRASVDALTKKIEEQAVLSVPPSPDVTASPTAMQEISLQLSVLQNDIQDVLDAVRNAPTKRKQRGRDRNTHLTTTPTNQQPANHKPRGALPDHSLIHSNHVTTAARDLLDPLKFKIPPPALAVTSSEVVPNPQPDSTATQDTPLPDAASTTHADNKCWKTVEGKARHKTKQTAQAATTTAATTSKTPTIKGGGRGKNTHQPQLKRPSTKRTWAEVVKSGGINIQIVLGNGNLGLPTAPTKRRKGERGGGAARRLRKKEVVGERGEQRPGRAGPGGSSDENGNTSREFERGEGRRGGGGPVVV